MHSILQWNAGEWLDVAQMHIKDRAQTNYSTPYFHFNFKPCLTCSSVTPDGQAVVGTRHYEKIQGISSERTFTLKKKSKHTIPNCNFFIRYFTYTFKDSVLRRTCFPLQLYCYYVLFPLHDSKVKVEIPTFTYTPLSFVFNFLNLTSI